MLAPTKPIKSCECGSPCGGCCGCTKESIGLGNVDNTADLNKPLSRDMVDALNVKVNLDIFTQLKNRVSALENSMGDIGGLENRMDDAELNIETLEHNYTYLSGVISSLTVTVDNLSTRVTGVNDALVTVGTRVDALEAKDSNNVKLSGVNVQTIQGTLKANDPTSGATDKTLVTANWVSQTGDGAPNNLIHSNGTEVIYGTKIHQSGLLGNTIQLRTVDFDVTAPGNSNKYSNSIMWVDKNNIGICKLWIRQRPDGRIALGLDIKKSDNTWDFGHIIYEST